MRKEIEDLTARMVQIDSTQGITIDVAQEVKSFLEMNGVTAKIDEYAERKANVEARIGPKSAEKIIISGHMDVVPIGNPLSWTHDPFSGKIIDNELWGRGSVDMKGGTAELAGVMVELLKHEEDLNYEIIYAATAEEEVGLHGARRFESQGIMENAVHLLIAEPTGLGVAILEKGVLWADITAKGKQAHGSRPDLGHNAIEGLVKLIPNLSNILPDIERPEVGKSTLNIGVINGGTVPNVVPEEATVRCDYRLTPGVNNSDIIANLKTLLETESNEEIKYSLEIDSALNAPPVVSVSNQLGEILANKTEQKTGFKPELGGMYYATDGAAFMENKQVSFAIFGPGSTELLHQTNERLDLRELDLARQITLDTLLELNSGLN